MTITEEALERARAPRDPLVLAQALAKLDKIGGEVEADEIEYHLSAEHVGELLLAVARDEIDCRCYFSRKTPAMQTPVMQGAIVDA